MILIIAYGNTLRGDDGAGIILGGMLEAACLARQIPVKLLSCHQLVPELVVDMVGPDVSTVVFVDTRIIPDESHSYHVETEPLAVQDVATWTGHHLSPVVLLGYAKNLYNRNVSAWQLTVPGVAFEHGENLSRTSSNALDTAQPVLDELIGQLSQP